MAISVDQIDLWRQAPKETEGLEFKEAKQQYSTEKLYEYCVAIGNEGGGHLLLGIQDKIPRIIVGTKAIDDPGGMSEKIFNKLGFRVDIEIVGHPEGRIVVIGIPGCPSGAPFHLEGAYLMRIGESVQPMSPERLRKLFSDTRSDWLEEPTKTGLGPASILASLDVAALIKLIDAPSLPTIEETMDWLVTERLIREEGDGAYSIVRIGALLLAKDLKEFPELSRKAPRVIAYSGTNKLADPVAYVVGTHGYAVGFQGLLHFVVKHTPRREVIEDGLRKSVPIIPDIVVRELLANALVHQDLSITGTSVVVEIFQDRIEVSNPGEPIVPLQRLIDLARSRNERLADLMRRMGICEERGSGIDKVVDAAESLLLSAPAFRATEGRTVSTVYGPRSFNDMDREDRVRACWQHCALRFEMSQRMTNQSLRQRFKLPANKTYLVSQVIANTMEDGLIKPDRKAAGTSKKFACYVPHWA